MPQRSVQVRGSRGVTLIELLAGLIILGILAAIAAPRLFDNRVFGARGYADELAGALRYAQRIALATGCNVRFMAGPGGYSAVQRNTLATCRSAGSWTQPVLLPDGTAVAGAVPAGVAANTVTVEFDSLGQPVSAVAPLTVGTFALSVDAVTGTVTVQ